MLPDLQARARATTIVRETARRLGFEFCGIARAMRLDDDARRLEQWLVSGRQGQMRYMEKHFEERVDPRKLVPGAKSVITLLKNYYPAQTPAVNAVRISKYAWGKDYHEVIRRQLREFLHTLRSSVGAIEGRGFVDSAPVLERSWAQRSGLGWIGKNGNLLNKQQGSFFFIATLITDLELDYDDPFARDYCGSCTRCIDACPTEAILPNREIDGSRCISYFTIELKDQLLPAELRNQFEGWAFGCDTCQDVCPWNRFSRPHQEPGFTPLPEILEFDIRQWQEMTEEKFRQIFRDSPLQRAKWKGLQRNIQFILSADETGKTTDPQKI